MPRGQVPKIRKGTKSCTECRRRKTRCIRSFDNAQTCRRCEEQDLECIAQTHTSGSTEAQRISSRHRVAQLESRVLSLTETVREMRRSLDCRPPLSEDPGLIKAFEYNSSDGSPSLSEQSIVEQPVHLRLLFENKSLSMIELSESQPMQNLQMSNFAFLLASAKNSLQRLIPSMDEIYDLTNSASEWLTILHSFFPLPSEAKCQEELIACYEDMHSPSVDTARLASWLLTVALIAEQLPPEPKSVETLNDDRRRQIRLSRAISDTVESKFLAHDTLMGSIQGLSISMQVIRLEIGRGNIHKAWLKLRRVIAISELIGLDKAARVAQHDTATEAAVEGQMNKDQLWDVICAADRLLGVVLNLSPITSSYQMATTYAVTIDGIVQNQVYLYRLTDIANKIQALDQLSTSNSFSTESYTFSLEISRDLKTLASQTPETWWSQGVHDGANSVYPDHIVQFLHYYIAMRIHLPMALRQGPDNETLFSCLACINACESIVQRYQLLSRRLPPGLFLSGMLDLQAFSAAVTLLLISHMISTRSLDVGVDKVKISNKVEQVIKLLHEKSDSPPSPGFAYDGFTALCSLHDLLRGADDSLDPRQIAFHAPLLGKVQVKRNENPPQGESYWSSELLSALGFCSASEQLAFHSLNRNQFSSGEPSFDTENAQCDRTTYLAEGIFGNLF